MKLVYLELDGFRGYNKPLRMEFGDGVTIIDGRNGAGKSTIFDAIEFALTGRIRRNEEETAAGETIADYVWWRGDGTPPRNRFVKVAFKGENGTIDVTRSEFRDPEKGDLDQLTESLCDRTTAPESGLVQLCTNTIIRDEQITELSLDMKETDRYVLLREALGAVDSEIWIERGAGLLSAARDRVASADKDVAQANFALSHANQKLDEVRARLARDKSMTSAITRLQSFANTAVPPDELGAVVREQLVTVSAKLESLIELKDTWNLGERERDRIGTLTKALDVAKAAHAAAVSTLQGLPAKDYPRPTSTYAQESIDLTTLAALGRSVGLRDNCCPLCGKHQSPEDFQEGIKEAETIAARLNEAAARMAQGERLRKEAEIDVAAATASLDLANKDYGESVVILKQVEDRCQELGLSPDVSIDEIDDRITTLRNVVERTQDDLRILDTLGLSNELERAKQSEGEAKKRLTMAQEKTGRARKGHARAQTLYDASRRAASETLDRRLERVLPLMSELYRRLRPHPLWRDIEYSIRGDVRKFLRLQVGEKLNPQFLFSSGQRRATGLAFLLSVNLSLAWSKWRTILLDDPMQHVDDFRAVNLAELLAHLVTDGRQVVCAVEDAELASLLCRRLPVKSPKDAKRITLGADTEGALGQLKVDPLIPHVPNALIPLAGEQRQTV